MEPIPISLVAHHAFCPRRAWLEAAGEEADSYQVVGGSLAHQASDDPSATRRDKLRAVEIGHRELGLVGRVDMAEKVKGHLEVVEYKATPIRRDPQVTPPMRIQLALQVLCLRDMGEVVAGCAIYFTTHHRRVAVELEETDFASAREELEKTRGTIQSSTAPEPLLDDSRCMGCSHAGICLPEERKQDRIVRRIHASDPDGGPVHLTTPGSRASIRGAACAYLFAGKSWRLCPSNRLLGSSSTGISTYQAH